jgi:serine protease Do
MSRPRIEEDHMRSPVLKRTGLALALAAAGFVGYRARDVSPVATALADPAPAAAPSIPARGAPDFSAIVRRYGPAVVNVSTTGMMNAANAELGGGPGGGPGDADPGDPFSEFFRRFHGPGPQGVPVRGLGSGFIVDPDGVVLTNAHVVQGASEVRVKLTDGREFPAKVVGVDRPTDVAVLRIDAKGLPAVRLGDPARTQVGEWVLAIGAPFGFENSATAGIVSAKARSLPDEGYVPFLQTDVAVNPGNSGGPLFNADGEVIGINSQIYSRSGGYQGLSFAIPIDVAMKTEKQLVAHGKVVRGRLGVTVQDVNQALAHAFGLDGASGALVSSVEKGSGAARAGVEPGDVIRKVDGKPVTRSADLPPIIADLAPGSRVHLDLWRKGAARAVDVTVGEQAGPAVASRGGPAEEHGRLGLAVRPLTPEERQRVGLEGGVVVEAANGPAERAGIREGDVVVAVNGTPVSGVEELRGVVAKAGHDVALLVQRGEARLYVPVELG